jgi:hypothetical protein
MSLQPTTIRVPADQPTIQAAVDAANSGDTVLVAPGEYLESVDLRGKEILVKSEVVGAAIVRAPDSQRSFRAVTGETSKTRVIGFGIGRGGKWGGGIETNGSSPVFDSCDIVGCKNNTGGGAILQGGAPQFVACDFTNCFVNGVGGGLYGGGGAIRAIGASATIDLCSFQGCYGAQGDIMMQEGGGTSTIRRSTLLGAGAGVSGTFLYNAYSGMVIEDCVFDSMVGKAIFGWAPVTVRRTDFRNITGDFVFDMRAGQTLLEDCRLERCQVANHIFGVTYSGTYALRNTTLCQSSTPIFQGAWTDLGGNDFNAICSCFGDIDGDGIIGGADLSIVLSGWQSGPGANQGDLSGDGETDAVDMALILSNWGVCK